MLCLCGFERYSRWVPLFFTLIETIYPKIGAKSLSKNAKSPLPVKVRYSKTSLLQLPNL